jgi:hypothetical protein
MEVYVICLGKEQIIWWLCILWIEKWVQESLIRVFTIFDCKDKSVMKTEFFFG